jgi:hypothetical protein
MLSRYKLVILLFYAASILISGQEHTYYLWDGELWHKEAANLACNIEAAYINKDTLKDIVVGNRFDTWVYFGGKGKLDTTVDVKYRGRCLAVCDYNGDGLPDMICMEWTNYDTVKQDYDGNLLFYYGSLNDPNLLIDTIPDYSIPIPTIYPKRDGFGIGAFKTGVRVGDFNGDGKKDILITTGSGSGTNSPRRIYIYMGHEVPPQAPDYIAEQRPNYLSREWNSWIEVADMNKDGFDDIIFSENIRRKPPYLDSNQDSLSLLYMYYGKPNFNFTDSTYDKKYVSRLYRNGRDSIYWSDWFRYYFSVQDVNCDGYPDILVGGLGFPRDSTKIFYGTANGIDTVCHIAITDPDPGNTDYGGGGITQNVGDFNNDGYDDFIISNIGYATFGLFLGGPRFSLQNPVGICGYLETNGLFPDKVVNMGDQNGDGIKDILCGVTPFNYYNWGHLLLFEGNGTVHTGIFNEAADNWPRNYILEQNYPNPFNPETTIEYTLEKGCSIEIELYNILGQRSVVLYNGPQTAGKHKLTFNAGKYRLASGTYFYSLKVNNNVLVKKMVLIK